MCGTTPRRYKYWTWRREGGCALHSPPTDLPLTIVIRSQQTILIICLDILYSHKVSPGENLHLVCLPLSWVNFYPTNFSSCINDHTEPMTIFTTWVKFYVCCMYMQVRMKSKTSVKGYDMYIIKLIM